MLVTDELILRVLQGESSREERTLVLHWRERSPENEAHFQELARLWGATEDILPVMPRPPAPDAKAFLARLESRRTGKARGPLAPPSGSRRSRWSRLLRGGSAAAVLLLAVLGGWRVAVHRDGPPSSSYGANEFVTGPNERTMARLDDGSVVRLAPESRIRISADGTRREVWLDGRAYFAVAPDPSRPFIVRTRAGEAMVLGTRFDVSIRGDELDLVVVEGLVALAAGGERVEVGASEVSRVVNGRPTPATQVDDVASLVEWMADLLVFQDTPLWQVAVEIETRYGMRVRIPDPEMRERVVTGWFTNQPVEDVLYSVCQVVGGHCVVGDSTASIEP